jgi:hypothetical protein
MARGYTDQLREKFIAETEAYLNERLMPDSGPQPLRHSTEQQPGSQPRRTLRVPRALVVGMLCIFVYVVATLAGS